MSWVTIKSEDDFRWYKAGLDVSLKYPHKHNGKPERYPCKAWSKWNDDPNGPYYYDHTFAYQLEVICDSCGSKKLVWPEEVDINY
jgi:hypothetical protein